MCSETMTSLLVKISTEAKCPQAADPDATARTGSCQYDNPGCRQWRGGRQYDEPRHQCLIVQWLCF